MKKSGILAVFACAMLGSNAFAASGEMGTGTPSFGVYGAGYSGLMIVWSLANPSVNFPAGCTSIRLTAATMGAEAFKMAFATLTAARLSGQRVRFFAHNEIDGGCGVDYVQLTD